MHDLKTAFDLLGIEPTKDLKRVRRAWRALVRSYHPDMARSDLRGARRRLAEINAAFDAISSCSARDVQRLLEEGACAALLANRQAQSTRRYTLRARQTLHAARPEPVEAMERPIYQTRRDDARTIEGEFTRLEEAAHTAAGTPDAPDHTPQQAPWHIRDMASKAFAAARIICAPQYNDEPQSLYL